MTDEDVSWRKKILDSEKMRKENQCDKLSVVAKLFYDGKYCKRSLTESSCIGREITFSEIKRPKENFGIKLFSMSKN